MNGPVFVAGHRGMVGSALVRALQARGVPTLTATRDGLDLTDQAATYAFLADHKPKQVIVAAAKVGGIHANATYPADFLFDNLAIAANVIEGSRRTGVEHLIFLGSSCIYPKFAEQPISEDSLLTGPLEPTNEAYAVAKIAGAKLCSAYRRQYGLDYRTVLPCNLYGLGDNYHPENSHVVPAMIRKFSQAKAQGDPVVSIWGTGRPLREFLFADDCAAGVLFAIDRPDLPDLVNLGSGEEVSIEDLARLVAEVVGFTGEIAFDPTKPDGTPRKLMDGHILREAGWRPSTGLKEGLQVAVRDFYERYGSGQATDN